MLVPGLVIGYINTNTLSHTGSWWRSMLVPGVLEMWIRFARNQLQVNSVLLKHFKQRI